MPASSLPTDSMRIGSGSLTALISPFGAELMSLCLNDTPWLWTGSPSSWPRRAPILFPHCGRCRNREIRVAGTGYPDQPIHGFAPTSIFEVETQSADTLTLTLTDSSATQALFPFAFRLEVRFAVRGGALHQEIFVANTGHDVLPVSAGFHPGFYWPLPGQTAPQDHVIIFDQPESGPVALPDADGLMGGDTMPNPVYDRVLQLNDQVFQAGSAIFKNLESRGLWYGVPGQSGLRLEFTTPHLVLWRWPGPGKADFLCIEPWAGLPDPAGFMGDLRDKPGTTLLAPGACTKWGLIMQPGA